MNREFLDIYNRELKLFHDSAAEFAEEFPGIAERLGGLGSGHMDPMIAGLFGGAAYLAARVQLKLKHEFPQFTNNLLDQLVPHYLTPTPSVMLAGINPPFDDPNLKNGVEIAGGTMLEARYVEKDRRVACKFRLASSIKLWPFEVSGAEFFPAPGALQALGLETGRDIMGGMQLTLLRRSAATLDNEPDDKDAEGKPDLLVAACRASELTFHLTGNEADSIRLYEKLFGHCKAIHFRYLDEFGDPVLIAAPDGCLQQIGFDFADALFARDRRVFRGFDLLRELFVFPQKFLGFRLTGLSRILPRIASRSVDIIFSFDQSDGRLPSTVRTGSFALYAAPAVNLFEMQASRVPVKSNEHEYHIVADRSRYLDYEVHDVTRVNAHFAGSGERAEVYPLYSPPPAGVPENKALFYTKRQMQRRRTDDEKRRGQSPSYLGTDCFITLAGNTRSGDMEIAELSVRVMCSNRHLTVHLPIGQGGADFVIEDNTSLPVVCLAGPTPPRESIIDAARNAVNPTAQSPAWRLISLLSLNHLGLTGRGTAQSGEALREIMSLFAGVPDTATEGRIRGVLGIESRPIVRRIRQALGTGAARGLEITTSFDERAYEGSGIFLFGAVLDRFFTEYAPINTFTQTVIRSTDRGEIMRWPARNGSRVTL